MFRGGRDTRTEGREGEDGRLNTRAEENLNALPKREKQKDGNRRGGGAGDGMGWGETRTKAKTKWVRPNRCRKRLLDFVGCVFREKEFAHPYGVVWLFVCLFVAGPEPRCRPGSIEHRRRLSPGKSTGRARLSLSMVVYSGFSVKLAYTSTAPIGSGCYTAATHTELAAAMGIVWCRASPRSVVPLSIR